MNSSALKHQAKLQEWAMTVQECRSSGLPVKRWCREKGITAATYYRWERELLSVSGNADVEESTVAFAELPAPERLYRNVSEGSATLQVRDGSITIHQELTPELLHAMIAALRSC